MRSNELRIGNWVQSDPDYPRHIFGIVKEIKEDEIISEYNERGDRISMPLTDYKSIPLTPEILEKAGFLVQLGMHSYEYYYPNEDAMWSIRQEGGRWQFCIVVRHDEIWKFDPIIESLHQLQNLYFALTGEELPIEL